MLQNIHSKKGSKTWYANNSVYHSGTPVSNEVLDVLAHLFQNCSVSLLFLLCQMAFF